MTEPKDNALAESTAMEPSLLPAIASDNNPLAVFSSGRSFHVAMEMAKTLSESTMVPDQYQAYNLRNGQWVHNPVGLGNCLVALEISSRMGLSPFTLMQNMDVVKGRPGFRGKFKAALVNNSPLFSRIKYEWKGEPGQDGYGCRAYATDKESGEVLLGTWVTWKMVKGEGWDKNAKWTTMADQMFMYRAASFWLEAHAPELTLGLPTVEEIEDVSIIDEHTANRRRTSASAVNERLRDTAIDEGELADATDATTSLDPDAPEEPVTEDAGDEPVHPLAHDELPFEVTRDTEVDREVPAGDKREPLPQEFDEPPAKAKPAAKQSATQDAPPSGRDDDLFNVE